MGICKNSITLKTSQLIKQLINKSVIETTKLEKVEAFVEKNSLEKEIKLKIYSFKWKKILQRLEMGPSQGTATQN